MKSVKIAPIVIIGSVFLFIISKSSVSGSGHSITSSLEDDRDPADNYGLNDHPPRSIPFSGLDKMVRKSAKDHKTSTTTQDSSPAELTSDSVSRNKPDLTYPDSSVSDPETTLPNDKSQQNKIIIDQKKLWVLTEACVKKYGTNNDITQHTKNNPYFIGPDDEFDINPKRGDLNRKLRINRAIIEKADEKSYQDQLNAEGIYDLQHKENVEAIFQSLAYEDVNQMTNIYNTAANMKAVYDFSTSELEQNNKNNLLNSADKGYIDDSTMMARIAEIFGPPPTDCNNLNLKSNIDEKNYQGSLQASIYDHFGPEVPSDISDGHSITSSLEYDGEPADNYGLKDRFPPLNKMVTKSAKDHETSTTTQDSSPAESTSDSVSRNRPDLTHPDSSVSGNRTSSSPDTQKVLIPPLTSSSSTSSPSMVLQNDVEDSASSTTSDPIATAARNSSLPGKTNSMLLISSSSFFLFLFFFLDGCFVC